MTRSSNTHSRARRWTPLSLLCAPASLLLSLQPQTAVAGPASLLANGPSLFAQVLAEHNRVDGLAVEELDDGTTILRLKGTNKPTFNVYRLDDPDRLVVDIAKSAKGSVVPHVPLDTWACGRVTVAGVDERGAKLVRMVVQLKRESSYIVVPDGDSLVVTVTPRDAPPEQYFARKSAATQKAELERRHAHVAKVESEATALKAKASRQAKAAAKRAADAQRKVDAAETAAMRARKAEARAQSAERQAQTALREAKSNRLAGRRALKKATAEREKAQNQRKAAEAKLVAAESAAASKRKEAERLLGAAEAVARKRLADAAAKHARADRVLSEAEREAERKLADAEGSRESARAELASAKKAAAAADARSARVLEAAQAKAARARAEAERAKKAAASADAAAKKKLATAESQAKARLDEAQAELKVAKSKAAKTEASAKARLDEAQRTLANATASAKAAKTQADRVLAAAKRKAKETDAAAARRLADANSKARQTEDAAARKLAAANSKAKQTEDAAARKLAAASSKAKQAEDAAARKLAAANSKAKQAEDAAARKLAAANSRAKKTEVEADRALAAANSRAKQTEAEAARALADANSRAKRTEADAHKQAEAILADARRQASVEAARELAQAKKAAATVVASAKREAATMKKKRLAEAEADASAKVARAEARARASAKKRLATAEQEAERKLAAARKQARKDSIAAAEKELARVRAQGGEQVAAAVKSARGKAKTEADAELAKARAQIERDAATQIKLARARASKAESEARAKLKEADAKLASASATLAEAKADRASAEKLHATAQKKLASAEAARKRAESEKSKAEAARKQAEQALAKSQKEAENTRGRARRKADARLVKAEREREAAVARQLAASKKLASVEHATKKARSELAKAQAEKLEAREQLAALQVERDDLRGQVEERDAKLAQMRKQLDAAPKVAAAPEPKRKRTKTSKKGRAKLQDIRFEQDATETRVIVEFNGPARFDGMSLTPTIQLLKFSGAKLGKKLERSLDASSGQGSSVRVVTSFAEGPDAKVIVSTRSPVKARLEEQPGALIWHFPNVIADAPAAATKRVAQRPARPAPRPKAVSRESGKVGGFASVPRPNAALAPAAPAGQADVTRGRRNSRGRWRGERIDIELQEAPIKDVLLLFSDIGRVNIIAGDGVDGSVTMKLKSVPWDQALDIILRSLSLGSVREGNVIRIATLDTLQAEQRDAIERANARVQLKPLETQLVALSYATVEEMVPKVQTVLSPRGTVTPDTRTNTLIIMDVATNIGVARDLVQSLDTQTPQVLIEARIVEARTTFTRQLGIQWGFDFTASPGTGNPTGLLFPNSLGIGGGGTGTPVDSRGLVLPGAAASPNYAVDLPAPVGTGAGGAVGMSFGSIGGNLNTNLRLSAAESSGEVRIISAPKVVTLDNSEATIEQGVQIPISQVSAQGVNTRFVNATLSLQVTPHVTNEGAVLLDVTVQKNEADFVNTGARGDPTILTRSANSRMLVNDADTAVIGGIYTRNKAVNYTKIPWLADVPIIGWFFKSKAEADTRSEVLIFLTPKIVNRASSIGG